MSTFLLEFFNLITDYAERRWTQGVTKTAFIGGSRILECDASSHRFLAHSTIAERRCDDVVRASNERCRGSQCATQNVTVT